MSYKVKLDIFEGPFDLLVYLIESARMSIYDIQVSDITSQYTEYIARMQEMDVDVSSEFMVLAAELIDIKSKLLLPRREAGDDEVIYEDPRSDLVARLLEYKKFKAISEMLREEEGRNFHIYEKPQEDISEYTESPDEYLKLGIEEFVKAFQQFLEKKKKIEDIRDRYEHIKREKISTEEKMEFIRGLFLKDMGKKISFLETIQDSEDKYDFVLSFSSIMEMIKQNKVTAEQKRIFGDILVEATDRITEEIVAEDVLEGENDDRQIN